MMMVVLLFRGRAGMNCSGLTFFTSRFSFAFFLGKTSVGDLTFLGVGSGSALILTSLGFAFCAYSLCFSATGSTWHK